MFVKQIQSLFKLMTGFCINTKILIFLYAIIAASCTSENPLTQRVIDGDLTFGGFEGVEQVQTLSGAQLRVSWTPTSDSRVMGYRIYNAVTGQRLKSVDRFTSNTILAGLNEGFSYRIQVKAYDKNGKEDTNSAYAYGIPFDGIRNARVLSSTTAEINFELPLDGEALEANIYCRTSALGTWQNMGRITDMSTTSALVEGLAVNTTYTCRVSIMVDGNEDNNLRTAQFTAMGQAAKIVFLAQPGNGQVGVQLQNQPIVHILDENDNIVAGGPDAEALVTLEIASTSPTGGAVLGTFSKNAVGGVVTFDDISFNDAGQKIITAKKEDRSSYDFGTPVMQVNSNQFNITAGSVSPDHSTLAIDPAIIPPFDALVADGMEAYTVKFVLRDQFGNPVSGVTPQFASNYVGDIITQPFNPTDASGETTGTITTTIADTTPPRTLRISSPSGLTGVTVLAPFKPGPASKLGFLTQPTTSPAGAEGLNELRVAVQDANGNLVSTGTGSNVSINMTIVNNVGGATLTGTLPVTAVNGIAVFPDLGIDQTGNGYKLRAASGALIPVDSNSFNITSGHPTQLVLSGADTVMSGECSAVVSLQLQDAGGNRSKATGPVTVVLSGLDNNVSLYSNGACSGAPLSSTISFSTGQDTKNFYLKDIKSRQLDITATDTSAFLTSSSHTVYVTPSSLNLIAEAVPPASPTPLTFMSGHCSPAIIIRPLAFDNSIGQVFGSINVTLTGINGSQAQVYSDPTCTTQLDYASIPLTEGNPPNTDTVVYLKDPRGENLTLNVADPEGNIGTSSLPQEVKVLASRINLTGPSQVMSGSCSAVFTVSLRDTLGNQVSSHGSKTLSISGLGGSTGRFYTNPACTGTGTTSSISIPNNSSSTGIYFKGINAEVLQIRVQDPASQLQQSQQISLNVTPSAFKIVAPSPATALTSECKGPFQLQTLDGALNVSPVASTITADLTGNGDSAKFYADSNCADEITQLIFTSGQSQRPFYFKGQYPGTLNLKADDHNMILASATQVFNILGDWGWLGTKSKQYDEYGDLLPFRVGVKPVAARYDGLKGPRNLTFDPTGKYLYVADTETHKVLKYDYENTAYIGWIGRLRKENNIGSAGSSLPVPSSALCISTNNNQVLPGWCLGGRSIGAESTSQTATTGGLYSPYAVAADEDYVYVANASAHTITRHNAVTGAFDGWIGRANTVAPTGAGTNGPAGCQSTAPDDPVPGWCIGGTTKSGANLGNGALDAPKSIAFDETYLYVGSYGAVKRFDKATGAFQGWIGMVATSPESGAVGCDQAVMDELTPGWCFGGTSKAVNPRYHPNSSGIPGGFATIADIKVVGNDLYILSESYNGTINRYDKTTGAHIERLPHLNFTWTSPQQMAYDGSYFYVADRTRLLKVGPTGLIEGWMGKVANGSGMLGTGCTALAPNDNTPGWCLNGVHKPGMDETSFAQTTAIAYDGQGSLIVTSYEIPALRKFDAASGEYLGSLALEGDSPKEWTSDRVNDAEFYGFDDDSSYNPMGTLVHGDFIYVAEMGASRIKKINKKTGQLVGWIGAITSVPTGGESGECLTANAMGPSPTWCLGAYFYPEWTWADSTVSMIGTRTDGIMRAPHGLATDGIWLYVTDFSLHRIQRFNIDTGAYGGWIGRISTSASNRPTGGDPGCSSALEGTFTPGWCTGGLSTNGDSDGMLYQPTGIFYQSGNLYVIDTRNNRVSSYSAVTGAFNGWIGRIGTAPTSGCTWGNNGNYNVSTSGWCIGGKASVANSGTDRGGGFNFDWGYNRSSIYSDGTHLYITNTRAQRLDKWTLSGEFVAAVRTRQDQYTNTWRSAPADVGAIGGHNCSYPVAVWGDDTYLYGANGAPCTRDTDNTMALWKMDKQTGTIVGWKGGVSATTPPTAGDPGCAGATIYTPGWCQNGSVAQSMTLGGFSGPRGMLSGDNHFLYITDTDSNRLVRVPK